MNRKRKKILVIIILAIFLVSSFLFFYENKLTGNIIGKTETSQTFQGTTAASASESTTTYIYAGNLLASKTSNSDTTTYYLQDHLGSNIEVLENTAINQKSQFYVFGESNTTSKDNKYLYTGKELDYESGLYYYGARYYDPEIGRFMQADALQGGISNPLSLNRYVYTSNNPLNRIDPSGNQEKYSNIGDRFSSETRDATYVNPNLPKQATIQEISWAQYQFNSIYDEVSDWWTTNKGYGSPEDHFAVGSLLLLAPQAAALDAAAGARAVGAAISEARVTIQSKQVYEIYKTQKQIKSEILKQQVTDILKLNKVSKRIINGWEKADVRFVPSKEIRKLFNGNEAIGFYGPQSKEIVIASDVSFQERFFVSLHELGHSFWYNEYEAYRFSNYYSNKLIGTPHGSIKEIKEFIKESPLYQE